MNQHEGTPVYFAVDYDAQAADESSITAYFSGVYQGYLEYIHIREEFGLPVYTYDIGVYGSYWVLGWCKSQGITTYFYQSMSAGYSGGQNATQWPHDNVWQRSGASVCGIGIDTDVAWGNEGAWLA